MTIVTCGSVTAVTDGEPPPEEDDARSNDIREGVTSNGEQEGDPEGPGGQGGEVEQARCHASNEADQGASYREGCAERAERAVHLTLGLRRAVSVGGGQGEGSSPPGERWARLVVDVPGPLSFGMWYRVLSAGPEEAVVVVHHHPAIVPRRLPRPSG